MLKLADFIREFPVKDRTNRDAEVPALLEFLKRISPIESLLDIGAHSSFSTYAPEVRKWVKRYYAIDILPDPETEKVVDKYFIGNANDNFDLQEHPDCVVSVSVFEHAGLSTYRAEHETEAYKLFKKCLELSKKYVWVSMDVGLENCVTEEQHCPITRNLWDKMRKFASNFPVKERFFYSQGPQANHPWMEHSEKEAAFKIPYVEFIGNQSIGVMEIEKT